MLVEESGSMESNERCAAGSSNMMGSRNKWRKRAFPRKLLIVTPQPVTALQSLTTASRAGKTARTYLIRHLRTNEWQPTTGKHGELVASQALGVG